MAAFSLPIRVYVEDTDAGGIVYYVNYLKYMERARTELLRSLGYDKPSVFEHGLMFVVKSLEVSYDKPAELDDQLLVTAEITKVGKASMLMQQQVLRETQGTSELLCGAVVKIACISQQRRQPQAIPEKMYSHLKSLL